MNNVKKKPLTYTPLPLKKKKKSDRHEKYFKFNNLQIEAYCYT